MCLLYFFFIYSTRLLNSSIIEEFTPSFLSNYYICSLLFFRSAPKRPCQTCRAVMTVKASSKWTHASLQLPWHGFGYGHGLSSSAYLCCSRQWHSVFAFCVEWAMAPPPGEAHAAQLRAPHIGSVVPSATPCSRQSASSFLFFFFSLDEEFSNCQDQSVKENKTKAVAQWAMQYCIAAKRLLAVRRLLRLRGEQLPCGSLSYRIY